MATWRRRAIEAFPDLRGELNQPRYTIYGLFRDLLAAVRDAHRASDPARLTAIYDFTEWCARSHAQPLWNSAFVGFYEHVFDVDYRWMWTDAAAWLPGDIRTGCEGLWEYRLPSKDFAEVKRLLARTPPRSA